MRCVEIQICQNCGATIAKGEKFCNKCGLPLEDRPTVRKPVNSKKHEQRKQFITNVKKKTKQFQEQTKSTIKKHKQRIQFITKIKKRQNEHQSNFFNRQNLKPIPPIEAQQKTLDFSGSPLQSIAPSDGLNIVVPSHVTQIGKKQNKTKKKLSRSGSLNESNIIPIHITQSQKGSAKIINGSKSLHQDKLKNAMTDTMKTLQREIGHIFEKNTGIKKKITKKEKRSRESLVPNSLNEILINLADLDLNIEASALVNSDGTILASAVSRPISDYLISTIVNTLGTISQDMISSLDCGTLKFIALHGTEGIIFLTPIIKNTFLILLLTGGEAKSGVIYLAKLKVKKQLTLFYAKKNLQKIPL
ncbi:MAG: zinc-ribbon domain-containing protein [Promethearchaeota archaeon]